MTECGPPALRTNKGIVLLYNGKNDWGIKGDTAYHAGSYCGGQLLISNDNPYKVIGRLDEPFLSLKLHLREVDNIFMGRYF